MQRWHRGIAAAALAFGMGAAVAAPTKAEQARLWDDVGRVAIKGPATVALIDEAVLNLPAGEVFVPQPQADKLLELFGNPGANPDMPGLILPRDPRAQWYMPIRFQATGYIKDDDARTWNADDMLQSLKVGTDEQNRERQKAGIPQMEVLGWSEPPRYEPATQRLRWALASRIVGAKDDDPRLVNYNTYALGRDGYFTMNLVAGLADLPTLRPVAEKQIAALEYRPGKHYADFDAHTDRVAAYGLSSLVVGTLRPEGEPASGAPLLAGRNLKFLLAGAAVLALAVLAWLLRRRSRRAAAGERP